MAYLNSLRNSWRIAAASVLTASLFLTAGLVQAQLPGPPIQAPKAAPKTAPKAPAAVPARASDSRSAVAARFPELTPEQVSPGPIPGLLEIRIGSKLAYISADGRYLLQGEIIDLDTDQNVTEMKRESVRRDVLNTLNESTMVVFSPAKVKHTITVFTDIDCGYCRKLHQQIADYNARGIKVRYIAFPRSGPDTDSWQKAEQVWCSKDRRSALTRSKAGQSISQKPCQPNPVAQHYQVGRDFGIQGTPAIIMESGELIGGYLDPAELAKYLDEAKAPAKLSLR